jgi:hypothetical protein
MIEETELDRGLDILEESILAAIGGGGEGK